MCITLTECCCKRLGIKPPRCYLGCLLTVRILSTIFTLVLFIFALLSRCVYFQFWKTCDVFFLLLHVAISACLIPLRKDDVFWRLHHLRQRYKQRGISIRRRREQQDAEVEEELELEEQAEKAEYGGGDDDGIKERLGKGIKRIRTRIRHKLDRQDSEDEDAEDWQKKLASGLHLGVCLLRLRISFALIVGMLHRAIGGTEGIAKGETSVQLLLLIKGLYIHIPLLWFQFLFAIVRQIRLWCRIGCARFYCWLVLLVTAGLLMVELPYHVLRENSDQTWCFIYVDKIDPAICSVFACIGPNHTRYGNVEFDKTAIINKGVVFGG